MNRSTVLLASTSILVAGMLTPAALAQCCGAPKAASSVATPANSAQGITGTPAVFAVLAASMASVNADPVNKTCPIAEGEVDAASAARPFKGVTIGFCCPGCVGKWDKKSDQDKMVLLAKHAPEAITAILTAGEASKQSAKQAPAPAGDALAASPAVKAARAYLAACATSDPVALNALFLDKGRATVSENASDEGTWETYRDHHLLPELKEMPGFVMTVTKEDVQTFGTTSIVRQIGSFTVPDPKHPEAPKKYRAAATYVVVDEGGTQKIAHLHWSSRAEKKADAAAPTKPVAGHSHGAGHEKK